MAYPTVSGPYGFQPINRVDGMPYAGATRTYRIASNDSTPIFYGDLVVLTSAGFITKFTGTDDGFPLGVFTGVEFTNAQGQRLNGQYYAGTSMTDATAKIVVDGEAAYKVVSTNGSGVVTPSNLASIGSNMEIRQGAGNTATGNSGASVLAGSEVTTDTFPIRVIDVVYATATGADAFPELIVKINVSQFNRPTGV